MADIWAVQSSVSSWDENLWAITDGGIAVPALRPGPTSTMHPTGTAGGGDIIIDKALTVAAVNDVDPAGILFINSTLNCTGNATHFANATSVDFTGSGTYNIGGTLRIIGGSTVYAPPLLVVGTSTVIEVGSTFVVTAGSQLGDLDLTGGVAELDSTGAFFVNSWTSANGYYFPVSGPGSITCAGTLSIGAGDDFSDSSGVPFILTGSSGSLSISPAAGGRNRLSVVLGSSTRTISGTFDGDTVGFTNVAASLVGGTIKNLNNSSTPHVHAYSSVDGGGNTHVDFLAPPTGVTASDGTSTAHTTVSWTAPAGNAATSYDIYVNAVNDFGTAVYNSSTTAPTVTKDINTTTPGVLVYFWVVATDGTHTSNPSVPDQGYTKLETPANVVASDGTSPILVHITWDAVFAATSYDVRRNTTNNFAGSTSVGTTGGTSKDDLSGTKGVIYYYWVVAKSDTDSNPGGPDTGYMSIGTPGSLSATDGTSTTNVTVTWSSVTGASTYEVYRNTVNDSGTATLIDNTPTIPTFHDFIPSFGGTNVAGTTYFYWVKAVSQAMTSPFSNGDSGFVALPASGGGEVIGNDIVFGQGPP
jgi:hypothetical protein